MFWMTNFFSVMLASSEDALIKTGTWFWFWSFSEVVYGFFWRTGMCWKECHHKLKLTAAKVSKSWSLILVCAVFLPRQIITYYNIEDVSDLTKTEVLQRMQTSAVACTTVYQWNKMNTAVWTLIHQTTICSCIILSIDAAWFGSLTIFSVAIQAFRKYYQQRGSLQLLTLISYMSSPVLGSSLCTGVTNLHLRSC